MQCVPHAGSALSAARAVSPALGWAVQCAVPGQPHSPGPVTYKTVGLDEVHTPDLSEWNCLFLG